MDYTVSLQVQHRLALSPTHLYEGYSVELQVRGLCVVSHSGGWMDGGWGTVDGVGVVSVY